MLLRLALSTMAVLAASAVAQAQAPPTSGTPPMTTSPMASPSGTAPLAPAVPPKTLGAAGNTASNSSAVREAKPEVYFVKSANGELVPLVGFTLEQFEKMLREEGAAAPPPKPTFRIDGVEATGTVDSRNARLQITFTIDVDAAGWVRVPLGLRGSVLEKQAEYSGPGKFTLEYDPKADEYALWLNGKEEQKHKLTVRTATAVADDGAARTLRLRLPRAWNSSLNLTVPEKSIAAEVSTGAVLDAITTDKEGSRVRVAGIGGDFSLRWIKTDAPARRAPTLLEAQADVAAKIDGHSVTYDAQLAITSFGGEFEHVQIRLPASTVLLESDAADVEFNKLPAPKGSKNETYEIRRIGGPAKSLVVRLQAVRPIEPTKGQASFDLGGIEVLDAVRQWGHLGVQVEGDWQVLWGDRTQIRQVDAAPEFFRGRNLTAVFEYFGRTFTLTAKIAPRETRVTVEPSYTVDVTARRAYLEARLGYRVGGAKVFTLDADFLDWQVDEVGPPELVDVEAIVVGKGGPLSIPLLQPSTGEFQIVVRAHRDLAEGAKSLELNVPRPTAGVVGPATWIVRTADNVALSPRDAAHTGLLRQSRNEARRYVGDRAGWVYSTDAATAKFTADYRVLSRTIRVQTTNVVTLGEAGGVEQKFNYVVAREPLDAVEFDVSPKLTDGGRLELRLDTEVLPWVVVDDSPPDSPKPSRIRAHLPQARLGAFEVTAGFPLSLMRPETPAGVPLEVPLLVPLDGETSENELRLITSEEISIRHVDEAWSPVEATSSTTAASPATGSLYRAVAPRHEVMLGLQWEEAEPVRELHVQRMWVQTVWLGTGRLERAACRLSTASSSAVVNLPPGATDIEGFVDSARIEAAAHTAGEPLVLSLPHVSDDVHVIDLRYRIEGNDAASLVAPTIENATSLGRTYRQLVFAPDVWLWNSPSDLIAEYDWTRSGPFWVRKPRLSQEELENWIGVQHDSPLPERANVYLFSDYGSVASWTPRALRRSTAVLLASSLVLAGALALLYLPGLRRPGLLLAAAIAVAALGFAYPEAVPLAIQASLGGALFAFIALLLERNVARRNGRALRSTGDAASVAPRSSTRTRAVPPAASSAPASTAAVEIAAPSAASGGAS